MYERISFKFAPYNLWLFKNDLHLKNPYDNQYNRWQSRKHEYP